MKKIIFIGIVSVLFAISIYGQGVYSDTVSRKDTFRIQELPTRGVINSKKSNNSSITPKVVDITARDWQGKTALMHSCEDNNWELTKELLQKGSSVNDISDSEYTPLMYTVQTSKINLEILDLLLSNGADLNFTNSKGESAFTLSYLHNNPDIAYYLLQHGAKIPATMDFELQAKLSHFAGDYYFSKEDLDTCKGFYIRAKQFYTVSLADTRQKVGKINGTKALAFLGDVMLGAATNIAVSSIQTNQMQGWQNLGMSRSNAYLMTMPYTENLRKMYSPLYEKNSILLYNEQYPVGASIDQKKLYYKNKIRQFEMLIKLMDGIVACIDQGLIGKELDSCISGIQLIEESKKYEKQKKQKERTEDLPDYY